jgi:hypothetical protein
VRNHGRMVTGLLLGTLGCLGTARGSSDMRPAQPASACVSDVDARFVFPPESKLDYSRDELGESESAEVPESSWEVDWDLPRLERGTRPHGIWVVVSWPGDRPERGSVGEVVAEARPTVMTQDTTVSESVSIAQEDSAVTVLLQRDRVVLRVKGARAVDRIFPVVPDSVQFYRRVGGAAEAEEFAVPVEVGQSSCEATPSGGP